MVQIVSQGKLCPSAKIAVNKNLVKCYSGKSTDTTQTSYHEQETVYLTGGTEFQIELFNPTQESLLAKIKLNGNYISSSGLVIYPGQRIFLDRYLDCNKKFKFDIYEVSGNSEVIKKAIEKNGLVEVEFYKENKNQLSLSSITYTTPDFWNTPSTPQKQHPWGEIWCSNSIGLDNCVLNSSSYNTTASAYYNAADVSDWTANIPLAARSGHLGKNTQFKAHKKDEKQETGRVGKGNTSNQTFTNVDIDFEWFVSYNSVIKILPFSQKSLTNSDIVKTRKYCTNCGKKIKPVDKYCSSCGTKQ